MKSYLNCLKLKKIFIMQQYNRYAIMKLTELMEVKNWNPHILNTFYNLKQELFKYL